jgi:hypothetical protein
MRWLTISSAIIIFAGIAAGWCWRRQLQAWYYADRLAHATGDVHPWLDKLVPLGTPALPALARCLLSDDEQVCANVHEALVQLGSITDGETKRRIVEALYAMFPQMTSRGQARALQVVHHLFDEARHDDTEAASMLDAAGEIVKAAAASTHSNVHRSAVNVIGAMLAESGPMKPAKRMIEPARVLIVPCLRDPDPAVRSDAIQLATHREIAMLQPVAELLNDPIAEVRRNALMAVASAPDVIGTDDLLHWLHDPDEEVRAVCTDALRSRGLTEDYLRLGRLLTDEQAAKRMQVLDYLRFHPELEPGTWLRRLSQDPSSAVRAAAIRRAGDQQTVRLKDLLEQVAQADPSPTVRQLALYYLSALPPLVPSTQSRHVDVQEP